MIRQLEATNIAFAYAILEQKRQPFFSYINYLSEEILNNTERVVRGDQPRRPKLFPRYMGWSESHYQTFAKRPEVTEMMDMLMSGGIAFAVLHEVAHHTLGHAGTRRSPSQRRLAEARADDWAVRRMTSMGFSPLGAMVPFLLSAEIHDKTVERLQGTTATGLEYEEIMDHPVEIRRLGALVSTAIETVEDDKEFIQYLRGGVST